MSYDTSKINEKINKIKENSLKVYEKGRTKVISSSEYLKENKQGTIVVVDDMTEIEHKVEVGLSSKNLFNEAEANITKTEDYFKSNVGYSTDAFYSLAVEPNETYIATFMVRTEVEHAWGSELGVGIGSLPTYGQGRIALSLIPKESYQNFATHTIRFTIPADVHIVYFQTNTEYKFKNFQIEKSTTPTAYAPFIADFSDCKVKVRGKNLVDITKPDYIPANAGEVIDNNTYRVYLNSGLAVSEYYYIYAPKGTKLTVTFDYELGGEATSKWFLANDASGLNSGTTWTVGDNGRLKISFGRVGGSGNNKLGWVDIKNLQVEVASAPTEYEPYRETEYTADADGTVEGFIPIFPTMTLSTDTEGALVNINYIKDLQKTYNNLIINTALSGGE